MTKHFFNGHMTFNDYFMMYLTKWKRAAVLLMLIWIGVTYLVISPLRCNGGSDEVLEFQDRLRRVSSQLETLRQQHSNLISQIRKSSGIVKMLNGNLKDLESMSLFFDAGHGPTEDYENLRRRVYSNTKELWYYISHELSKVMYDDNKVEKIQAILDEVAERKRSLLSDQEKLPELDGYQEWRQAEAANVSDLIQRRLRTLQNPPDCRDARKLICNLNKGCGFGCQLHHIVYCLIFAYATERTLILNSKGWRYNNKGWDYVFYPISDSCTTSYDDKVIQWPVSYDAKVVSLPFIDSISQKPKFLPLAVPKDLAHRIVRFNGDPASWWIGQMLKFILKPRPSLQKAINETIAKMHFKTPIVGVHIRRTDKVGTEAAFHHIHEYMTHVKAYYERLQLTRLVPVRRVYLATDDANVLEDARKKYPEYEFLGDPSIAKTAATHRRYTPLSLTGLLVDLHMLSMCDYIVCTFSSQVGRVAYEMMQTNRVDASDSFFSLDDIYYFGGQNAHDRVAVLPHDPTDTQQISLQVGDLIGIAGNHWNGYGRGTNKRTNLFCRLSTCPNGRNRRASCPLSASTATTCATTRASPSACRAGRATCATCPSARRGVIPYKGTASGQASAAASWASTGRSAISASRCRAASTAPATCPSSASAARGGTACSAANRSAALTATPPAATARRRASAAAGWAGRAPRAAPASRCRAASTVTATSRSSASARRATRACCARHLSARRGATTSAATAGGRASAAARWAGRARRARSATPTRAACTAPAAAPGSASASPAGGACCAMKS